MNNFLKGTLIAIGGSFIFGIVVGGFFTGVELYLVTVPLEFFGVDPFSGWRFIVYIFWLAFFAYGIEWFRNR